MNAFYFPLTSSLLILIIGLAGTTPAAAQISRSRFDPHRQTKSKSETVEEDFTTRRKNAYMLVESHPALINTSINEMRKVLIMLGQDQALSTEQRDLFVRTCKSDIYTGLHKKAAEARDASRAKDEELARLPEKHKASLPIVSGRRISVASSGDDKGGKSGGTTASYQNYVAIRVLAYVDGQLTANPNNLPLPALLALAKKEAKTLATNFEIAGIDPAIRSIAKELVRSISSSEQLLLDCGVIDADYDNKLKEGTGLMTSGLIAVGGKGLELWLISLADGSGDPVIILAAHFVAHIGKMVATAVHQKWIAGAITKERRDKLLARVKMAQDEYKSAYASELRVVLGLAKHYGWDRPTVGYDATELEMSPFRQPSSEPGNLAARVNSFKEWQKRRPRDPFATYEYATLAAASLLRTLPGDETALKDVAREVRSLAEQIRNASMLMPPHKAFLTYRKDMKFQADMLMSHANRIDPSSE